MGDGNMLTAPINLIAHLVQNPESSKNIGVGLQVIRGNKLLLESSNLFRFHLIQWSSAGLHRQLQR